MNASTLRRDWAMLIGALAIAGLALVGLFAVPFDSPILNEVRAQIDHRIFDQLANALFGWVLSIEFVIVVSIVFALQYTLPADPTQRLFGKGLVADAIYFFWDHLVYVFLVAVYVALLLSFLNEYFAFLKVPGLAETPAWLRFLVGVLAADFIAWFQHFLKHKVPFLWRFHKVHHSTTEMTLFSDFRFHVIDRVVTLTFSPIPFFILGFQVPEIVAFEFVRRWYNRFYHAGIHTDLGPLRLVLVTPQSHRIHHSRLDGHHDKNLGNLFTIWDRLFGTATSDFALYPPTGLANDAKFPCEYRSSWPRTVLLPFYQQIYPLAELASVICRQFISWFSRPAPSDSL